jgi:hypothetical protein
MRGIDHGLSDLTLDPWHADIEACAQGVTALP